MATTLITSGYSIGQDAAEVADRERIAAERYLDVLIRRPRPGVALDRVYGYHVQNDSLDALQSQLTDPTAADAAQRQMVWGLIQLQRGRSAEAAEVLSAAENQLPDDAACSFYLGRAYLAVGKTELAAEAMERAIERGPLRAEALPMFTELGRIYSRAGQSDRSLAVWTRLEKLFPGDTRVGGQIARTLAEEGNASEAKVRYESLAKAAPNPDEQIAYAVQAAEMQRMMGDPEQATEALEKILARLNPGSWLYIDVRNRIEAGFLKSGDYDALANYYGDQLSARPDDLALQIRLSRILVTAGRLTEAKTWLQSAIDRAPDDLDARIALIDVLVQQNDVADAVQQFEQLADRDPGNPDHLIRWGRVLLENSAVPLEERRTAAAAVWSRLADARGDDAVTLSQIADLMRGIDRSEDAIALYRRSIEVDPDSPQYREYLGEYLHSLDRSGEAIEVWQSIAEGNRRSADSLVRLAEVYTTFKLPERAIEAWEQAAELDLTFAQELRYAAKLTESKQYEAALRRLDSAAKICETPDEQEQLLKERISTYQSSGTLIEQIGRITALPQSVDNHRTLALMYGAAGDLTGAERSIRAALTVEPDNTDVLLVAADIAERQNRLGDAAELFEKLSLADQRFRTNYLQRVADLQIRMGQIDLALQTCEAIIDANPASPESYQHYARRAFDAGREEEAIAALRRAMIVAPRDNSTRRMLANHFADRYRTDEAIEMYWQSFNDEPQIDGQINVITSLAPLYDRKTDLDSLIGRIEEISRKDGDARAAKLMIAAAYEAVQDFGAARAAIEPLLAIQPRDLALLENMVRLATAAGEIEMAAEYQERITALANTSENRFKLVELQLESGRIDVTEAISQRIAFLSNPSQLGNMVRSAMGRGDLGAAKAICEQAIRADPSLWDIKLIWAELLLLDSSGDDATQHREQAMRLVQEIRNLELSIDTPAPTRRPSTSQPNANQATSAIMSSPMYWSQSAYQLARMLRIGPYASANYASSNQYQPVDPMSFGHARSIAASLMLINEVTGKSVNEVNQIVNEKIFAALDSVDVENVDDANALWELYAMIGAAGVFSNNRVLLSGGVVPNVPADEKARAEALRQKTTQLMWRLTDLDLQNGSTLLLQYFSQRLNAATRPGTSSIDLTPLTTEQLQRLTTIQKRLQSEGWPPAMTARSSPAMAEMMMQSILGHEFHLAGQDELALQFAPQDPSDDASYDQIIAAIQFYNQLDKPELADGLVDRLLPAARREKPKSASQLLNQSNVAILSGSDTVQAFNQRHQQSLIDAAIASWTTSTSSANARSAALGEGYTNIYMPVAGSYRSLRVHAPLSPRLADHTLISQVLTYSTTPSGAANSNPASANPFGANPAGTTPSLSQSMIDHLLAPLDGASVDEQKTRHVIAALAHWWSGRPEQCYQILVELCDRFPGDVELRIEQARLANELKQPRLALETLDSFDPLDSRMLVRKEMAAMNLAAEIGDTERAKVAAERLFGMRLDVSLQLALADQLQRLGLKEQSAAVLARTRGGRMRDENTELQIARAFLANNDKDAAAEVAFALLRRLSSGRTANNNQSYYQQQVVSILQTTGRLEPLIERAKRRVESSPQALRPRQELADLYAAAGREDEAGKVWETLSSDAPANPQQLIARADALAKGKKYSEAVDLYLDAFEKDPSRFDNDYYKMTNAVRAAGNDVIDAMFRRLIRFPSQNIPTYRMDELAGLGDRNSLSDAKRDFIGHLLKSPSADSQVFNIIRNLPENQRGLIPEYRDALLRSICSDDAFMNQSQLWRVSSRSSGGTAIGPLADVLQFLHDDEAAEKQFRDAAQIALQNESHKSNAAFMLALIDVKNETELESSLAALRQPIDRTADDDSAGSKVSSGLLWQSGQVLETIKEVPIELLIQLYQEAKRSESSNSSPQFNLDCRLVDTLLKAERFDEARELLLDLYRSSDFSEQNQYNPGYGDYQMLDAMQWTAEKLMACDAPIDAMVLYRSGMSDPDRFERAKRWGGSRSTLESFRQGAQSAIEKVTAERAAKHLNLLAKSWESDLEANPIELMESLPESILLSESPSSLALAITMAASDDAGQAELQEFANVVRRLAGSNPQSWRLPAVQVLIAQALGTDETPDLVAAIMERLPQPTASTGTPATPIDVITATSLYDLYPVASALAGSEKDSDHELAKQLVDYLNDVSESANDSSIAMALARISGDAAESITRILDVITSRIDGDAVLPSSTADQCLQLAIDAAKAGQIRTAARALTLALQHGPPLRKISNTQDPFAITSSRSSSSSSLNSDSADVDPLITRVSAFTKALSETTGVSLVYDSNVNPPGHTTAGSPPIDEQGFRELTDAYLAILAPADRAGAIFSYAERIATSSYDRRGADEPVVVSSVPMALAIAASKCGRSDQVLQTLTSSREKNIDSTELSIAILYLALLKGDAALLQQSLDDFTALMDARLPDSDQHAPAPAALMSITGQMASESQRKSEVIDTMFRAIWPVITSEYVDRQEQEKDPLSVSITSKVDDLIARTKSLIQSDAYTANRHRELLRLLDQRLLSIAIARHDDQAIGAYIDRQLETIESQPYPSGIDLVAYKRQRVEQLVNQWIKDGLVRWIDQGLRQSIQNFYAVKRDDTSRFEPSVCLAISQLPPDDRLDLLQRISVGRMDSDPILFLEGIVSYEVPPAIVRRQLPQFDAVTNLPTSSPNYPVVNSLLMWIDHAASVDQIDAVIAELQSRSKKVGDDADIAVALAKLARAKAAGSDSKDVLSGIASTLSAVNDHLKAHLPQKNDADLVFPSLHTHLIIRAHEAGLPLSTAEPMIRNAKVYAVRSQKNFLISAVARATAKMGIGRAAGATTQSPLESFDVVALVTPNRGDDALLTPLYAVNKDGWISGTSGYDQTHLMFKYPVVGSFEFSATIEDGGWGEADIAYGGVIYQANGWEKNAKVLGMGNRGDVDFKVESIETGKLNVEAVRVGPDGVQAICNGVPYVNDIATHSYPFVSVHQHKYRTSKFRDIRFKGDPVIPREVNLIDPTMRGWGTLTRGKSLPKMLLPIGPKQDEKQILEFREKMESDLAAGPLVGGWSVRESQLHFKGDPSTRNGYDPASHIEYVRPLQDGETIRFEFFWKDGEVEFAPTIGRTILSLGRQGMRPDWIAAAGDLASVDFVSSASLDPPYDLIAADNVPVDDDWNTLVMKRNQDVVAVSLNDGPLIEIPVIGHERPGIYRNEKRALLIRSIRLSGDWPERVPPEWISP